MIRSGVPAVPSDDPFSTLGLEPRFDLSPAEVAAAHLRVVSRLHPDRASDPLERERLVRAAAAAGAAKQRLSADSSRAEELLELLGARISGAAPALAPAFLMETLELREEIEEACGPGAPPARRAELAASVGTLRGTVVSGLGAALLAGQRAAGPDARSEALQAALDHLVRLRYLDRMVARLREA